MPSDPSAQAAESALLRALAGMDPKRAADALDGAFDKLTSEPEAGVMVDGLADGYPSLATIVSRLAGRVLEEVADEAGRKDVVLGCALGMLALIEYGVAESMRSRFRAADDL